METQERHQPCEDPLLDEVRERQRQLLADYDNDLDKYFAALRKMQEEHPEEIIRRAPQAAKPSSE